MKKRLIYDIAYFAHQRRVDGIGRCCIEILRHLESSGVFEIVLVCSLPEEDSAVYNLNDLYPNNLPFRSRDREHFSIPEEPPPPRKASFLGRMEMSLLALFPGSRFLKSLVATIKRRIKPPPEKRRRSVFLEELVRDSDVYFSPFHAPIPEIDANPEIRSFQIVHDLIFVLFPHWFPESWSKEFRGFGKNACLLAVSQNTKRDLLKLFPDTGEDRVAVIPLGVDGRFAPSGDRSRIDPVLERYGVPPDKPYILSVATLEPRKNFDHVLRSFASLIEKHADEFSSLRLVLTGGKGWLDERIREAYKDLPRAVRDRIVFTGYVEDADLPLLYGGAACFCYMSLYEGFGLPPLEAIRSGVPVVVSDNSSLPEVVGDAGILLDARDSHGLVEAWLRVLRDETWRSESIEKGLRRAERFTWERYIERVLSLIVPETSGGEASA